MGLTYYFYRVKDQKVYRVKTVFLEAKTLKLSLPAHIRVEWDGFFKIIHALMEKTPVSPCKGKVERGE